MVSHLSTATPSSANNRSATQLKLSSMPRVVTLSLLCASSGLILWFARPVTCPSHNRAWRTPTWTLPSSLRPHSSPSSAMYLHATTCSEHVWSPSLTSPSHPSLASPSLCSMMSAERSTFVEVWCSPRPQDVSSSTVGLSETLTIEQNAAWTFVQIKLNFTEIFTYL